MNSLDAQPVGRKAPLAIATAATAAAATAKIRPEENNMKTSVTSKEFSNGDSWVAVIEQALAGLRCTWQAALPATTASHAATTCGHRSTAGRSEQVPTRGREQVQC